MDCTKQGSYRITATDACLGSAETFAQLSAAVPSLTMQSLTLKLNPSGGGTWSDYHCEESTDGGWSWAQYGAQGQNWLLVPTDGGEKNGRWYRITAQQGGTTASVTGRLDNSAAWSLQLTVMDIQTGTADVKFTGASPMGVGPWTYHWFKDDVEIGGASGRFYEITDLDCSKQGTYRLEVSDNCERSATVDAYLFRQGCTP
ncbi:MAG TPA: hypothetical protein VI136_21365 [Verrucomicrobiae bacterium]